MSALDLIPVDTKDFKRFSKQVRAIGIDLGTTNSTVAEIIYNPSRKEAAEIRCLAVEQQTSSRS